MKEYSGSAVRSGSVRRFLPGLVALALAGPAIAATERATIHAPKAGPGSGAQADALGTVAGTPYRYLNIAGAAFHPVSSSMAYSYAGVGCINRIGSDTSLFTHKVVLPQGSVVKYLRLYYDDTSGGDIAAFFTTYDMLGNYDEHTMVSSAGSAGYGSMLSAEITHVVDHFTAPAVVTVNMNAPTDASLQFCGVRIAYYDVGDDTIFRNGFD